MGQDKGLMLFDDKPMIVFLLEKLKDQLDEVILVLRNKKQCQEYQKILRSSSSKYDLDLKFFSDEIKSQGPLSGIFTGLSHVDSDYSLVIPCDSPFISPQFIDKIFKKLRDNLGKYDAIVPFWGENPRENLEPLHAIYNKKTKKIIHSQLLEGKRDVKSFINKLNTLFVNVDELDPSLKSFKNFNQPEDFK